MSELGPGPIVFTPNEGLHREIARLEEEKALRDGHIESLHRIIEAQGKHIISLKKSLSEACKALLKQPN